MNVAVICLGVGSCTQRLRDRRIKRLKANLKKLQKRKLLLILVEMQMQENLVTFKYHRYSAFIHFRANQKDATIILFHPNCHLKILISILKSELCREITSFSTQCGCTDKITTPILISSSLDQICILNAIFLKAILWTALLITPTLLFN